MLKKNLLLFTSLIISFILACIVEHRIFTDYTAISDDVRNQIYWMARLIDPSLYPSDFIASYFTQPPLISPVVKFIYQFVSCWIDPMKFSQILPFILVIISTFFLFQATSFTRGIRYAFWVSFAFNLYIWTISGLPGGLPRGFFYPLFFYFLWIYESKNWKWLPFCFILQSLIYPVAFILSFSFLIFDLLINKRNSKNNLRSFQVCLAFFSGIAVLALRYIGSFSHAFGELVTLKDVIKMPEFYADGRVNIIPIPHYLLKGKTIKYFITDIFPSAESFIAIIGFSLLVLVILYIIYKEKKLNHIKSILFIPKYIWILSIVSILLYFVSLTFLFYLYMPQRYIQYSLWLVLVFLGGNVLYQLDCFFKNKRSISVIMAILALLVASVRWDDDLILIKEEEKKVYSFLLGTPKDSLIAAPIKLADNIPAFSKRSVLASYEANIPFHKGYYKELKERILDLDQAYFSKDLRSIKSFIREYGIDYIVIDDKNFKKRGDAILDDIPDSCIEFKSGRYSVISKEKIDTISCSYGLVANDLFADKKQVKSHKKPLN